MEYDEPSLVAKFQFFIKNIAFYILQFLKSYYCFHIKLKKIAFPNMSK